MNSRIDAHCHLWTLERGDYGWLDPNNPDLTPLVRDFTPEDLSANLARAGIDRAVLVQAAPTVAETDFMLSLADVTPEISGVVGWVDLSDAGATKDIDRLAQHPYFKGVRPMLQDLPDTNWIATAPHPDAVAALLANEVRFDALVTPHHLAPLQQFVDKYPDLAVIIDHAAKPVLGDTTDASWEAWDKGMAQLARSQNVSCKFSGLVTELGTSRHVEQQNAVGGVFEKLLAWFGAGRLMWGSDWPVVTLQNTYDDWDRLSQLVLSDLSNNEKDNILGFTAKRVYDL